MSHINISMKGLSVMLGMPTHRDINPMVVKSIFETKQHCDKLKIPFSFGFIWGGSVITMDRNRVIDEFMKSDANRLFWVDSDIVWESKDFIRMLALSQKRDVICGAYPAKKEPTTYYIKFKDKKYDELGLVEIEGVGLGFTVMTKKVVKDLVDNSPKVMNQVDNTKVANVFRIDSIDGSFRTEDMALFSDIRDLGYNVYLDVDISLGHIGTKVYTGSIRDAIK